MKSRKYWRNDRFSIFEIEEEGPQYRTSLSIFRMLEEVGKRGRVIFHGALPFIDGSVKMGEGETYEVVDMDYGWPPDIYREGVVVVRLKDCQMRRYWVKRMVLSFPRNTRDIATVEGYVEVECEIEWNEPLEIWEEIKPIKEQETQSNV